MGRPSQETGVRVQNRLGIGSVILDLSCFSARSRSLSRPHVSLHPGARSTVRIAGVPDVLYAHPLVLLAESQGYGIRAIRRSPKPLTAIVFAFNLDTAVLSEDIPESAQICP